MRVSLRKASKVFHKLPNGQWGLVDWYDNIRKQKAETKHGDKGNGSPSRTSVAAESGSGKQEGQSSDCPSLSRTGAGNQIRTGDPHLGKVMLYQLSYARSKL